MKPTAAKLLVLLPAAALAGLLLSGCSFSLKGAVKAKKLFLLTPPESSHAPRQPAAGRLLVADMTAPGFLRSSKIVFSKADGTRGAYQYGGWMQNPPERLTALLLLRLDQSRVFDSTARSSGLLGGDFLLNTELLDFYHDCRTEPGEAVVELRAELIDIKQRTMLRSKTFRRRIAPPSFDAEGAVAAFDAACGEILDELIGWLGGKYQREKTNNKVS